MSTSEQLVMLESEAFRDFNALTVQVKVSGTFKMSLAELADLREGTLQLGSAVAVVLRGFVAEAHVPVEEKDGDYDWGDGRLVIKGVALRALETLGRVVETPQERRERLARQADPAREGITEDCPYCGAEKGDNHDPMCLTQQFPRGDVEA